MEQIELNQLPLDDLQVVRLRGDIDLASSGELADKLAEAASAMQPPRIAVLDLSGIGFMSTLGARSLCAFNRACALHGVCTYWVAAPGSTVRNIIDLTGLADIIPVFDSVERAQQGHSAAIAQPN